MAIQYIHPETQEPVEKERWRWVAVYKDGSSLEQFEVKPGVATFHRFGEIDTANVDKFVMVHDTLPPVIVRLPENAKLIHAYVTGVHQHMSDDNLHVITEAHKGYKVGYELDGHAHGVLIDFDDSVSVIEDFNKVVVALDKLNEKGEL